MAFHRHHRGALAGAAALAALIAMPAVLLGGSPSLRQLSPRGAQRGTAVVVDFRGARLQRPQSLLAYRPGIALKAVEQVDDNHVRCTLEIAADCATGLHPLRLVTASGITELKLFAVGDWPEITEAEPNGDQHNPQAITLPATVNGTPTPRQSTAKSDSW